MAGDPKAFVIDASLTAARFLPDEATTESEAALQATATHDVWVPALWLLETANLLLSTQRRRRITADKRKELANAAAALRITIDRQLVSVTTLDELGSRHALSAYDAA